MALCAKLYLDGGIFFLISRSEISKMMSLPKYNLARSTKKYFMALCAKLYLDGGIFFLILRSKIKKKMPPSKEYFAAAGGKTRFRQPQTLF